MNHAENRLVVIDTNFLISALFLRTTVAREQLGRVLRHATPAFSLATFAELDEKRRSTKFDRFATSDERLAALESLRAIGYFAEASAAPVTVCRDPKDNMFLALAKTIGAEAIITGDADLLALHPFEGIPILRPRQWCESLGN